MHMYLLAALGMLSIDLSTTDRQKDAVGAGGRGRLWMIIVMGRCALRRFLESFQGNSEQMHEGSSFHPIISTGTPCYSTISQGRLCQFSRAKTTLRVERPLLEGSDDGASLGDGPRYPRSHAL